MSTVAPEFETGFLVKVQRLLSEGAFVATYKYALLLALADISVEAGRDTADTLDVSVSQIAEKFIGYYWRQIVPYAGVSGKPVVLAQNTGRQAGVISKLAQLHSKYESSLPAAKRGREWQSLLRNIAGIVQKMPLWRLQTIGPETVDFLYANAKLGSTITLRPGVMFCFRKYHPLITELVRSAWARYIRRFNLAALGTVADMHEFLFGTERAPLSVFVPLLRKAQNDSCFYCEGKLHSGTAAVDHFIPWSRYAVDLGHNFVLAHATCNGAKSDYLAADEHLKRWISFQRGNGDELIREFKARGVVASLEVSAKVAQWAYQQTFAVNGQTWIRGKEFKKLAANWTECFLGLSA
jgi:hypothetical protein